VTVPWAEAVVEWWYRHIGVLATEATVRASMYRERVHILDDSVIVEEVGAPGLVPLIEQGITTWHIVEDLLVEYLSQFSPDIEALVLGCTHYPLIRESIERVWHDRYQKLPDIIDPGVEAAGKFRCWLERKYLI
jgi:glutamate racemase